MSSTGGKQAWDMNAPHMLGKGWTDAWAVLVAVSVLMRPNSHRAATRRLMVIY
jgi:hypothetical protein